MMCFSSERSEKPYYQLNITPVSMVMIIQTLRQKAAQG